MADIFRKKKSTTMTKKNKKKKKKKKKKEEKDIRIKLGHLRGSSSPLLRFEPERAKPN